MLNTQPIEKRVERNDHRVEVHSIFKTIQGEGPFCGTPCIFIRLAGCNLKCPMCDTEYTSKRRLMSASEVTLEVDSLWCTDRWKEGGLVAITGGEPFRQNISPLLKSLTEAGFYIQIETNGTLPPSEFLRYSQDIGWRKGAYIVCSPKSGKVNPEIWREACCVKYVMGHEDVMEDGLPRTALGHTANPHLARPPSWWDRPVYLQPMDTKEEAENKRNQDAVLESCMEHGHILQIQIHKLLGVE